MPVDIVLGLQYGDEGKGKVVDYLAKNYDYVVRFHGGNNAGHTLIVNNHRVALHALPSGILYPHTYNVIGNGCVIDPIQLAKEIEEHGGAANLKGRLLSLMLLILSYQVISQKIKLAKNVLAQLEKVLAPHILPRCNEQVIA